MGGSAIALISGPEGKVVYDRGTPTHLPEAYVAKVDQWYGNKNDFLQLHLNVSYFWKAIASVDSGSGTLAAGTIDESAVTLEMATSWGTEIGTSLASSLETKLGIPNFAEVGSSVSSSITTSIAQNNSYRIATTSTVSYNSTYTISNPDSQQGQIITYQLFEKREYFYKYCPPSALSEPIPPMEINTLGIFDIPQKSNFSYRNRLVE